MVVGAFGDALPGRRFAFRTLTFEWATTRPESSYPLAADEW